MSEVLEIEVDGEIDDGINGFESERRSPQWGLPAAVGVAGTLLLAVLVVVVIPMVASWSGSRRPPAHARVAAPSRVAPVEGAKGALAAWGRFAVSGDLKQVDGWLVSDGPQYRVLSKEAVGLAAQPPGPPAYDVRLAEPAVTFVTAKTAKLRGDVTWTRAGEADQRYRWEIMLDLFPTGRWLLWTVTDRQGAASSPGPAGAAKDRGAGRSGIPLSVLAGAAAGAVLLGGVRSILSRLRSASCTKP